jgi:osmotically-inducible protein OsmY
MRLFESRSAVGACMAVLLGIAACAPLLLGGAVVGGSMIATDRRSSATQLEDQVIEVKAGARVREVVGERGRVSPTSYNRLVLLTGDVATEADKAAIEQAVARVDNVKSIVNELVVMGSLSLGSRTNDALISTKVKASIVDTKDLYANSIKVVTERGVVYLMGRVTEREAAQAANVARGVNGVQKVVRVFEILTDAELAELQLKPTPK